jgi:preprotein translocase subunit SecD
MTQLVFRTGPTGRWDLFARRLVPKVAVFSGKIKLFKMSEVVSGPFDSQQSALKKYGNQLPDDLEIAPASPKGMAKGWFLLKAEPIVSTKDLESVNRVRDAWGNPAIGISLKPESAEKMKAYTTANQGKRLAIMLDNQVISTPAIAGVISKDTMITGHFTMDEVSELIIQFKIAINKNQ